MSTDFAADLRARIRRDADQCVMCGLCLPHCPTYLETRDEGESPRGRISLIKALAGGDLAAGPSLEAHLDRCLGCRACESVCPSQVPYGALIDAGRGLLRAGRPPPQVQRLIARPAVKTLLSHPAVARAGARVLRLARTAGLTGLAARAGGGRWPVLRRLQRYLPSLAPAPRLRPHYPAAQAAPLGRIALFTGCMSPLTDAPAVASAVKLLNRLGYAVDIPRRQVCCGALHQHGGDLQGAWELAQRNLDAFDQAGWAAVLFLASGCGATLKEYPQLPSLAPARRDAAARVAAACRDITGFLAAAEWDGVTLTPGPRRIAVHDPCSMTRVLRGAKGVYELLRRLPGSDVGALDGNRFCCGAAGSYMLTQPGMADRLLAYKVDAVRRAAPDVLVSSNVGCALHLQAGLREAGLDVPVMHPVTLLERHVAR